MATQEAHVQTWAPGNAAFTSINPGKDPICEAETRANVAPFVLLPFPLQLQHLPGTSGTGVPLSPRSSGNTSLGLACGCGCSQPPTPFGTPAPSRAESWFFHNGSQQGSLGTDWQLDPGAVEDIPESSN